jgi:GNAT superfamily N-acetyltransferase
MAVRLEALTGVKLTAAIPVLAQLRIAVFREWPYLYDGHPAYEEKYLGELAKARDGVIVAALDGTEIVGAATAAPLAQHSPDFAPLFADLSIDPDRVFYFGESVLLPAWRGQGIGHRFFDRREAAALDARTSSGARFTHAAFCGVVRATDDPRQPPDYTPLDAFWQRRGFELVQGMFGSYSWKEIGAAEETEQLMQFWLKRLQQ